MKKGTKSKAKKKKDKNARDRGYKEIGCPRETQTSCDLNLCSQYALYSFSIRYRLRDSGPSCIYKLCYGICSDDKTANYKETVKTFYSKTSKLILERQRSRNSKAG